MDVDPKEFLVEEPVFQRFVRMNGEAARVFENVMRLIDGDLLVVDSNGREAVEVNFVINLADSFTLELHRAYRLAKAAEVNLKEGGIDTTLYKEQLSPIVNIRNVIDHGRDAKDSRKRKIHTHHENTIGVDESSIVILGASRVLRGQINLYDFYKIASEIDDKFSGKDTPPRYAPRT